MEETFVDIFYVEESKRANVQLKRVGHKLKKQYRCTFGEKKGRLVSGPDKCGIHKDPAKVRQGKATARLKNKFSARKGAFSRKRALSKRLKRFNDFLSGKI